ncbi:MAG: hypothetical protein A2Z16_04995 [Chloroflexi bacterium RBG_16_54_18]|nr:MAG: hypothetical protein A2Z16_04995 [Chloroflexi bacterium RBG_16_54_18]
MTAVKNPRPPILVTGAHRSGTTWVGKMLTASRETAYISEPFNRWRRPGVFNGPIQYWYTYVCSENAAEYNQPYSRILSFRYNTLDELRSLRSFKDAIRMARDARSFLSGWIFNRRPLVKDPFAFFSAPWIAQTFGCAVVITMRHPAAFVSSLKRLDWPFDFSDLIDQPLLVQDWLAPFYQKMLEGNHDKADLIGNGSLLWRILYQVGSQFIEANPEFILVKHEELSRDPFSGFQTLYSRLDLDFSTGAQKIIRNSSASGNPTEIARQDIYGTRVDSQANLANWKRRLSSDEIKRIREITGEAASRYYGDDEWIN